MSSPKKKKKQQLNADGTKKKTEPKFVPMDVIISAGIHPSSSQSWGITKAGACAKLFNHIVEANDGREQQIVENKTYYLDNLSKEELQKPDDLGNTLPFLAVYHDRPSMLQYLYARGLDMGKFHAFFVY